MPTRTSPATTRLPRKTAVRKPAPKKTTTKTAAKPPAEASAAADAASLRDLVSRLSKLEVAGFAGRLVQGWRKDLEAIIAANRRSYAGLQEVVRRQAAQIAEAAAELQTVGKVMATVGATESVRNLDDLALASLKLALNDVRELADLAASSQREAFELVQQRVTENIDEVHRLLRK
jgi:phasin family protein